MIKQRWNKRPPAELKADRVLLYRSGTKLPPAEHGFQYLDRFDVVLVRDGSHEDELIARGHNVNIATLRVPVFRADVMWVRANDTTAEMLERWRDVECQQQAAPEVAKLARAIYYARPLIWMLPDWRMWHEEHEVSDGFDVYAVKDENDWRATVWRDGAQIWVGPQNAHETAAEALDEGRQWIEEEGSTQ